MARRTGVRRYPGRKRRRAKYTWLPVLGEAVADTVNGTQINDSIGGDITQFAGTIPGTDGEVVSLIIRPLVFDAPRESSGVGIDATTPMGEFLQNEYFIKRIVGKLFLGIAPLAELSATLAPAAAKITSGLFIARADDNDVGAGDPIGAATVPSRLLNYNPENAATAREPWIWRRSWILSSPAFNVDGTADTKKHGVTGIIGPSSNAAYGSVLDGPHIDAKTARRVRQDERLFFAQAVRVFPLGGSAVSNERELEIKGHLELRVLGQVRRPRNTGAF